MFHKYMLVNISNRYFQNVLDSTLLGDSNEIELHKDGSWSVHDESKEIEAASSSSKSAPVSSKI